MGRWLSVVIILALFIAGVYWVLNRTGSEACYKNGGRWDSSHLSCSV